MSPMRRPREHVLESESRHAFEAALPARWICRWQDLDYGIDATVEVVTEDGLVTGDVFAVQLKGTDEEGVPRVQLTTRHLRYYEMYPLPVMIAVYSGAEEQVYVRWIQEILEEEGRDTLTTQATMTVRMREEDLLRLERTDEIRADLRTDLAQRRLRPSVTVVVAHQDAPENADEERTISIPGRLRGEIQWWADRLVPGRLLVLLEGQDHVEQEDERLLRVQWRTDDGQLTVAARGRGDTEILEAFDWTGPADTLRYWVVGERPTPPVGRVLLSAAVLLSSAHDPDSASRLLLKAVPACGDLLEEVPPMALLVAAIFDAAMRSAEAMDLSERLLAEGHYEAAGALAAGSAMSRHGRPGSSERYRSILRRALEGLEGPEAGARTSYNLANNLRREGRFREAVGYYNQAVKLDPSYNRRAYWWEELGACFFETGHYTWAADAYRRALEATDRERLELRVLPKLADSLAFAGRYEEAVEHFREYEERVDEPDSEWVLKALLLDSCVEMTGIREQRRNPQRAEELCEEAADCLEEGDLERARELTDQALTADLLYVRVWLVSERALGQLDDQEGVVFAQAMLAVLRRVPDDWAAATISCLATGDLATGVAVGLLGHLAKGGVAAFGPDYVERVRTLVTEMEINTEGAEALRVLLRVAIDPEYSPEEALEELAIPGRDPEDA